LYLPANYGFKYLLVVVDAHSKKVDVEPLKTRDAETVKKAFEKIYKRDILMRPKIMTTDDGSEFKSSCNQYFKDEHIHHITAPTGRHRMVSLVERKNQIIGSILHQIMAQDELETGETSRRWVKILRDVIDEINKHLPKPLLKEKIDEPIITKANKVILPIGTEVKTLLNVPEDVATGARLHGKFRSSDIRWSRNNKEVERIILQPAQPPLYRVDGIKHSFTRQQLNVVHFV
jgi:transposase-like protein